ncbi:unnamed protein product, partial [Urochloa humidicola]
GSAVVVQCLRRDAAGCISYWSPILPFLAGREDGDGNSEEHTVRLEHGRGSAGASMWRRPPPLAAAVSLLEAFIKEVCGRL